VFAYVFLQVEEDAVAQLLRKDGSLGSDLQAYQLHFATRDWQAARYNEEVKDVGLNPDGRLLLHFDYQE
jgi:hypothetical protein